MESSVPLADEDMPQTPDESARRRPISKPPTEVRNIDSDDSLSNGTLQEVGSDPTPSNLVRLIRVRPFMLFFCYVANMQYPRHQTSQSRNEKMKKDHVKLYWFCIISDLIFTWIIAVFLLAFFVLAGYKTLVLPLW